MTNPLSFLAAFLMVVLVSGGFAAAGEKVCTRDEQVGCLTFQIVGVEPNARLIDKVSSMSAGDQAKKFGKQVLDGMLANRYEPASRQDYYLVIWMDVEWGDQPLPAERIRVVCYDDLRGGKTYFAPQGRQLDGIPTIKGIGAAHTAISANCSGGVGAGWIIPNDVAQHMAFAMICADGATHYPFQRNDRQEGILHSGQEIKWYLRSGWEYVLSAAIWRQS